MGKESLGSRAIKKHIREESLLVFINNVNSNMHFFLSGDAFDINTTIIEYQ